MRLDHSCLRSVAHELSSAAKNISSMRAQMEGVGSQAGEHLDGLNGSGSACPMTFASERD